MCKTKSYVPPYKGGGNYQSPRMDVRPFDLEVNFCNSFNDSTTEPLEEEVEFEW